MVAARRGGTGGSEMDEVSSPKAAPPGEAGFHERRIVLLLAVIEIVWIAGLVYGLSLIL
jgi:hypothetical protein